MPEEPALSAAKSAHDRLTLRSQLTDLSLVTGWVQALASRHQFSERTTFAIELCLEEALSNVIRHGYIGDPTQKLDVEFSINAEGVTFVIEDAAPHFNPLDQAPLSPSRAVPLEELVPGGQGIPLLRKFADAAEWQPLENGNRLTLHFSQK